MQLCSSSKYVYKKPRANIQHPFLVFTYPEFNSLMVVIQSQAFCGSNVPPGKKKRK